MISFIIPAYNEEVELPATLAAIRSAAAAANVTYEVIVVDDASIDATASVARESGASVVTIHRRQIAAARNAGANAARGDVLIFVDADTRIRAEHLSGALEALASGCAGGGARLCVDSRIPRWGKILFALFGQCYFGLNLGAGAFLFTTREKFSEIGGFDESYFASEEVFFTLALKRLGRFELLRIPAMTSGRKLRLYSGRQILTQMIAVIFGGKRAITSRDKLEAWYGGAREERAP